MKPVSEMTPVELLDEFGQERERWRDISKARDQGHETFGGEAWTVSVKQPDGTFQEETRYRPQKMTLKVGMRWIEIQVPSEKEELRWTELCAEINRRFSPSRPPFNGPYRG